MEISLGLSNNPLPTSTATASHAFGSVAAARVELASPVPSEGNVGGKRRLGGLKSWSGKCGRIVQKCGESSMRAHPVKIGDKWMEYQGVGNWEGLLDPLDENLRSEILRYGEFVEAAYNSFEFDLSSEHYASCKFSRSSLLEQAGVRETGYCLTKNLKATCGVRLPEWVDRAPRWMMTRSSWIGYVAVCQDRREIARLGRRDVVIALRGTVTCLEWIENLRASLTCLHGHADDDAPMVESGFWSLYTSGDECTPSLREMIREEVAQVMATYADDDEPISLTLTGHSLGAALATLAAYDIRANFAGDANKDGPMVTVVSFGGPRVGNRSFRSHLERGGTKILRIVNSDDPVTKVPGFLSACDGKHVGVSGADVGLPGWLRKGIGGDPRWKYADLGQELRLSSSESSYLDKWDVATCHDLGTYLHLVSGFVSSTCPLRATARKMLHRIHHK
ncbi:hypothetical protein MLD38_038533 [Melastoma candidum]|uniref:Uncharacterized protein n=1 Tax=Melastoma candidum TaxID=119954 RepID=A0ACB9KZF4_9MYRT|nr:hypothetical protein MLD38_038533 [Melastoma candidum]